MRCPKPENEAQMSQVQMATNLVAGADDEVAAAVAVVGTAARPEKRRRVRRMTRACLDMAATLMRSGTSVALSGPAPAVSKQTFAPTLPGKTSLDEASIKKQKICLLMNRRQLAHLIEVTDRLMKTKKVTGMNGLAAAAAAVVGGAAMRVGQTAEPIPLLIGALSTMMILPTSHPRALPLLTMRRPHRVKLVMSQSVAVAAAAAAVPGRPPQRLVRQRRKSHVVRPKSHLAPVDGRQKAPDVASRAVTETQTAAVAVVKAPFRGLAKAVMRMTKASSSWAWMKAGLIRLGAGLRAMRNCLPKAVSTASGMSPAGLRQSEL
jgi:uncharacterized membrane protein (UPF0136 family)